MVRYSEQGVPVLAARAERVRGELNPCARLTRDQVREIRTRYVPRVVTQGQLAAEYGVSRSLISLVVAGAVWKED